MSRFFFTSGMTDKQLEDLIREGFSARDNKKISLDDFLEGISELVRIYGSSRVVDALKKVKNITPIYNMPKKETITQYDIIFDEAKQIEKNRSEEQQLRYEYMQQINELAKSGLYDQMMPREYFYQGPIKNIDPPRQINYIPPQVEDQDIKSEGLKMRGIEYLSQPYMGSRQYTHMRAMLQAIWNIQYVYPSDRFDIDSRFSYDANALRDYIKNKASISEIDLAHQEVVRSYKGRGRPKGARNKDKVAPNIDDVLNQFTDSETEAPKTEDVKPVASDGLLDSAKFVTHPQLDKKINEVRNDFMRAVQSVQDALEPTFDELKQEIEALKLQKPHVVELKQEAGPNIELGVQHRHFAELLMMCHARLSADNDGRCNVWLYGPTGTGKTTAAKMVAKALGLTFYMQSALETGFQILGYVDAHGKYVTTLFRQCWEHGGVIILDEIDSYLPSAAMALNGALANGSCPFADKVVPRHKDCIIIAGANTTGLGGTIEYTGRNKMDAATLDRFVMLDWPIDEALEAHLCPNANWLAIVRHCRKQVIEKQIKGAMITPRASIYGSALLRAGLTVDRVMRSTLQKGMTDAQWQQIKPSQHMIDLVK